MKFFYVCFGMMIVMLGIWVEAGTAQTITATEMPDANLRAAVLFSLKNAGVVGTGAITFTKANMEDTRFTSLTSQITPANIGDLTGVRYAINLTRLSLSGSVVSTITISNISEVGSLTALTALILSHNSISNISVLSKLTALDYLDLSNNRISNISALSKLTALTYLNLSNNNISNISALSKLTALEELRLNDNRISDLSALSGLTTSLEVLFLNDNRISDLSALSGLTTALEELYLDHNRISETDAIVGLTSLERLTLHFNRITNVGEFTKLSSLTSLTFFRVQPNFQPNNGNNLPLLTSNNVTALEAFLWTRPDPIPAEGAVAFGRYPEDPPTEAFSFIIVFSAAVFGFEKADITVETELQTGTGTATLKALSPVGRLARTYTATIELPAQASGTVRLIVHANAAETDLGRIDPSEDIASRPIAFTTLPVAKTEAKTPKRKVVIQCPVGWVKLDGFAKRNRRVLLYEVNLEMDLHNRVSIYKPASVAIYVHPDEGLENLEGWKLQVATPYNRHKAYLLTAENSVVVASKMEGVAGGFAFIENPEETPFPMTEMGFAGTTVPGFDYRLYDDTGRRVDFGIACYKRGDISHVLKNMEDPSVFRKVDLETFDWDAHYLRSEWTVPVPVNVPGAPSAPKVNLVGKWADLKKQ